MTVEERNAAALEKFAQSGLSTDDIKRGARAGDTWSKYSAAKGRTGLVHAAMPGSAVALCGTPVTVSEQPFPTKAANACTVCVGEAIAERWNALLDDQDAWLDPDW